jgi:hypothetical protein
VASLAGASALTHSQILSSQLEKDELLLPDKMEQLKKSKLAADKMAGEYFKSLSTTPLMQPPKAPYIGKPI